jgi:hypothetical protein
MLIAGSNGHLQCSCPQGARFPKVYKERGGRYVTVDFSTPEDALISLEDAYRKGDIEATVAAKDFRFEAMAILSNVLKGNKPDDQTIDLTVHVLELSYRTEIKKSGFPDIAKARCEVLSKTEVRPRLVRILEQTQFLDGRISQEAIHAVLNETGWHVVIHKE